VIKANIDGSRFEGDWRAGSVSGHVTGERQQVDSSPQSRLQVFEEVCRKMEQEYYDPAFGGVDWAAVEQKYRPQAQNAPSDSALFETVNAMLGELKSSHLKFALGPSSESAADSAGAIDVSKSLAWRRLSARTGYLKIANFQEGPEFLQLVDRAFQDLNSLPALLIDLRGNGGGTLSAAMRVGDHLMEQSRQVGYFATRSGLERRGVQSMNDLDPAKLPAYARYDVAGFYTALRENGAVALLTGGRANPVYRGKVGVLVNRATASAAEAFAAVLQELHLAVLIGPRPTAGKMLSARELNLSGGWILTLPEADFRTPGGLRLEGRGATPDVLVKPASGNRDVPLIEAAKLLERP
jgi:carboxyl-terminal processing protease